MNENTRSSEVKKLLNLKPGWIIRRGTFVFILILLGIFAIIFFIPYPLQVTAYGKILPSYSTLSADTAYYCELRMPGKDVLKIKAGQKVLLRVSSFAYRQPGLVYGKVDILKRVPADSFYTVKVSMPSGLKTNGNKTLIYTTDMQVQATVIIPGMRLGNVLLEHVKKSAE